MKNKKVLVIALAAVVVLAAVLLAVSGYFKPETAEGSKTVELTVIFEDGSTKEYTVKTDAEYLGEALLAEEIIAGSESQYGLYVTEVAGVTADDAKKQWWCFNDGEGNMLNTGVDTTPIYDGDSFQAVLSTY